MSSAKTMKHAVENTSNVKEAKAWQIAVKAINMPTYIYKTILNS